MSKEVMRQALDVLKYVDTQDNDRDFLLVSELELLDNAITALRKALTEQPAQQEPVAWMTKDGEIYKHECWPEYEARPLVFGDTSPPAQRTGEEWFKWWRTSKVANSTEAEIDFADFMLIVRAVESEYGIKENT